MSRNRSLLRNLLSLCPNLFNRRTLLSTQRKPIPSWCRLNVGSREQMQVNVSQNAAGWTVSAEDGSDGGEWKTEEKVLTITINLLTKGRRDSWLVITTASWTQGCLRQSANHFLPCDAASHSQTRRQHLTTSLSCAALTLAGIFAPHLPPICPGVKSPALICCSAIEARQQTAWNRHSYPITGRMKQLCSR